MRLDIDHPDAIRAIIRTSQMPEIAAVANFIAMAELRNPDDRPGYATAREAVDALACLLGVEPQIIRDMPRDVEIMGKKELN